jgi:hypothetical protein
MFTQNYLIYLFYAVFQPVYDPRVSKYAALINTKNLAVLTF